MNIKLKVFVDGKIPLSDFLKDIETIHNVNNIDLNSIYWETRKPDNRHDTEELLIPVILLNYPELKDDFEKTKETIDILLKNKVYPMGEFAEKDFLIPHPKKSYFLFDLFYDKNTYFFNKATQDIFSLTVQNLIKEKQDLNLDDINICFDSLKYRNSERLISLLYKNLNSDQDISLCFDIISTFSDKKKQIQLLEDYCKENDSKKSYEKNLFKLKTKFNFLNATDISSEAFEQLVKNQDLELINLIDNNLPLSILQKNQKIILKYCKDNTIYQKFKSIGFNFEIKSILEMIEDNPESANFKNLFQYKLNEVEALEDVLTILKENNQLTLENMEVFYNAFTSKRVNDDFIWFFDKLKSFGISADKFDYLSLFRYEDLEANKSKLKALLENGARLYKSSILSDFVKSRKKTEISTLNKIGFVLESEEIFNILNYDNNPTKTFIDFAIKKMNVNKTFYDPITKMDVFPFWRLDSSYFSELILKDTNFDFSVANKDNQTIFNYILTNSYRNKFSLLRNLADKFHKKQKTVDLSIPDYKGKNTYHHFFISNTYSIDDNITKSNDLLNTETLPRLLSIDNNFKKSINTQDLLGKTPLHYLLTIKPSNYTFPLNELILNHCKDINFSLKDNTGKSLLDLMVENQNSLNKEALEVFLLEGLFDFKQSQKVKTISI